MSGEGYDYQRRSSVDDELVQEMRAMFDNCDTNHDGKIDSCELSEMFQVAGIKLPGYRLREIVDRIDRDNDHKISWFELLKMVTEFKDRDVANTFINIVRERPGVVSTGGTSEVSAMGTTHAFSHEEKHAFSEWINNHLSGDPDCAHLLPIASDTEDLFAKVADGILFCKIINLSSPDTIDERAINRKHGKTSINVYKATENQVLAINSASSIGCSTVNIGAEDLKKGTPHLVLGLMWQIIRIGLFSKIDLVHNPGIMKLLKDGEDLAEMMRLAPDEILIRWVNYHLANSGSDRRIANFSGDIADSEAYTILLQQISPAEAGNGLGPLGESDLRQRAELMLRNADRIGCREFVTPNDVVNGNHKLNLAFVANLFNNFPALKGDDVEGLEEIVEETRDEKTFRNWINSLGLGTSYVGNIYTDLIDGFIFLKLFDVVRPGSVDWAHRVNVPPYKKLGGQMKKIENCNYAVELGNKFGFSLVGIDGNDLHQGIQNLTLSVVWQLMRAYTLSILRKIADTKDQDMDRYIIDWVNEKLESAGKPSRIASFKDPSIADGFPVLDLIDAIQPAAINPSHVRVESPLSGEDRLSNAKYAVSMGRRIGARIYALPEDLVEVQSKMVLTVFACLMVRGLQNK